MPSLEIYIQQGWVQVRSTYWVWNDPYVEDTFLEVSYYKDGTPESWSWCCMPDYCYRGNTSRKGYKDIAAVRRAIRAWKAFPGDKTKVYAECCGHSQKFCKRVDPTIDYV